MKDLNEIPEFSRYFRVISPSEIDVNKDDIFYRDKYNDIINYVKVLLTNSEDISLQEYLKPKGAIIINANPGTDVKDFLKLISMNYYVNFIQFKDNEIFKSPEDFIKSLLIISEVLEGTSEINAKLESGKNPKKSLLLIDQQLFFKKNFEEKNILDIFINAQQTGKIKLNSIDINLILVWLNYDIQEINQVSRKIYDTFDLFIKIPILNKIERETVLRDFLEKNPKIVFDINTIVNCTENWEVIDIKLLLKVGIFKHFLNYELNDTSNEITDSLLDLIESGEYIPSIPKEYLNVSPMKEMILEESENRRIYSKQAETNVDIIKDISGIINEIQETRISEFMLNQLYENAASKNYNELIIIIDKLNKNEPLEDNDRKLLAKYPFILNDSPNRAQINLEKAKKRVDHIKQAFGK